MAQADGKETIKVCVLGAGSYGTAMAMVAARRGHDVYLYTHRQAQADFINDREKGGYNPKRFLKAITTNDDGTKTVPDYLYFPKNITATTDLGEAVKDCKLIMHCIPTQPTKSFLAKYGKTIPKDVLYVCTGKGIDDTTGKLLCDIIPEGLGREVLKASDKDDNKENDKKTNHVAYLSGPSFAIEIMKNEPMAVTIASYNIETSKLAQKYLNQTHFRTYVTDDVMGVELGGALKNPLAIGAGIAAGLGYGQSTVAAMITRGAVEIQRLAMAMGGRPETLAGLAGMGDLMLTCFSRQSRNNRCGFAIGKGKSVKEACDEIGEVVEGLKTAPMVEQLRKEYSQKTGEKIRMPLFQTLVQTLEGKVAPKDALYLLTEKDPGEEGFLIGIQDKK